MSWLTPHWLKAGPGVDRDAPPKTGLALLADVVIRNAWELVQLNLLILAFSLPLVTLPAAHVAAARITSRMIEDRHVYLFRDFWDAFRAVLLPASALGALAIAAVGIPAYAAAIFVQAARSNLVFAFPFTVSFAVAVFALVAMTCAIALMGKRGIGIGDAIRLGAITALARPLPVLAALAVAALLWLLHVVFYPVSIFMPAVLNFSFGMLAVSFGVHQATVRLAASSPRLMQARTDAQGKTSKAHH